MVSSSGPEYTVRVHRAVQRFLSNHPDLAERWPYIMEQISGNPRSSSRVDHLKNPWHCSYRWREGSYRIKYDVDDDRREIRIYDANNRGDVYQGRRGQTRRR